MDPLVKLNLRFNSELRLIELTWLDVIVSGVNNKRSRRDKTRRRRWWCRLVNHLRNLMMNRLGTMCTGPSRCTVSITHSRARTTTDCV